VIRPSGRGLRRGRARSARIQCGRRMDGRWPSTSPCEACSSRHSAAAGCGSWPRTRPATAAPTTRPSPPGNRSRGAADSRSSRKQQSRSTAPSHAYRQRDGGREGRLRTAPVRRLQQRASDRAARGRERRVAWIGAVRLQREPLPLSGERSTALMTAPLDDASVESHGKRHLAHRPSAGIGWTEPFS
jgi:hypothetical protein